MALGNAIADKGGKPLPPRPALRVRVTGGSWRTIASAQPTYSPTFEERIEINASTMTGGEIVMIQLVDAIDGGLIAFAAPTFAELVTQERQTLQLTGQASHLELEMRLMPEGDGADEATLREMTEGLRRFFATETRVASESSPLMWWSVFHSAHGTTGSWLLM